MDTGYPGSRRRSARGAVVTAMVVCTLTVVDARPQKPAAQANPQAAALQDFQRRLMGYVELRTKLGHDLQPLKPTANAADLKARQESLAAAIRQTRKGARMGDLIPTPVAALLTRTVQDDFKMRPPAARRAARNEVTGGVAPVINRPFPANAALPTIPPLLLAQLPPLPDNLQYRFLDRDLVILDGDTQIIIDYVPNVLPPR